MAKLNNETSTATPTDRNRNTNPAVAAVIATDIDVMKQDDNNIDGPTNNPDGDADTIVVKDIDVLSGRGGLANKHPGNLLFRRVVAENKDLYQRCKKKAHKNFLVVSIVAAIEQTGGRFLRRDESTGKWIKISKKEAMSKTSQALRETENKSLGSNSLGTTSPPTITTQFESTESSELWAPTATSSKLQRPKIQQQLTHEHSKQQKQGLRQPSDAGFAPPPAPFLNQGIFPMPSTLTNAPPSVVVGGAGSNEYINEALDIFMTADVGIPIHSGSNVDTADATAMQDVLFDFQRRHQEDVSMDSSTSDDETVDISPLPMIRKRLSSEPMDIDVLNTLLPPSSSSNN